MAGKGPPPTPTKLKILRGNPGRRPLNKAEPEPPPGEPGQPTFLDREAKAMWRRLVKQLGGMGILAVVDRERIAGCCYWWSRFVQLQAEVKKQGDLPVSAGKHVKNPRVEMMRDAYKLFAAEASILGIGPAARSRIVVDKKPATDDPAAKYFRNG